MHFRQEALEARICRCPYADVEDPVRLSFSAELRLGHGESVLLKNMAVDVSILSKLINLRKDREQVSVSKIAAVCCEVRQKLA